MNNEGTKKFRNAIGGFHSDDVINYIQESDWKHAVALSELTAQLEEANRRNEELSAKNEELSGNLIDVQEEKDALTLQLEEVTAQRDEAQKENAQSAETLRDFRFQFDIAEANFRELSETSEARASEWAKEKEDLLRQIAELREAPATPEYDPNDHNSPAYKLEMYDKVSAQLGDILINANRNADEILAAAREDADKLRADTEAECLQKRAECEADVTKIREETAAEAAYIRRRLSDHAASMLNTVSTELHANVDNCIREMNDGITDMQYEIQILLAQIKRRSDEINEKISYFQSSTAEGIEQKLNETDLQYGTVKNDGETPFPS